MLPRLTFDIPCAARSAAPAASRWWGRAGNLRQRRALAVMAAFFNFVLLSVPADKNRQLHLFPAR